MDVELRRLLREARSSGSIDDEARYLNKLRRAGQLTNRQLEIASYMGYPAAEQIYTYDTPYEIARLMGSPPPNPPQSNWFCEPIDSLNMKDPNDTAHLWVDNISFEYEFEAVLATILLTFRFILEKLPYLDPYFSHHKELTRGALGSIYETMCEAILQDDPDLLSSLDEEVMNWSLLLQNDPPPVGGDMSAEYVYIQNILYHLELAITEGNIENTHHAKEALREAIDLCIHSALGTELCQYLTANLPPYILGYLSLEEILR
jgi:hypothetical protein